MYRIRSQYIEAFGRMDQDDYFAMLTWLERQGKKPSFGTLNDEDINAALVFEWKAFKDRRTKLCEEDLCVPLPPPGSFPLYARIRESSKYYYQMPKDSPYFEVKLGCIGRWHGNNNEYRLSDLQFFYFSAEAGEFWEVKIDQ